MKPLKTIPTEYESEYEEEEEESESEVRIPSDVPSSERQKHLDPITHAKIA